MFLFRRSQLVPRQALYLNSVRVCMLSSVCIVCTLRQPVLQEGWLRVADPAVNQFSHITYRSWSRRVL